MAQTGGNPPKAAAHSGPFNETIDFIIGHPPIGPVDLAGASLQELTGSNTFNRSPQQKVINNAMPLVHIQPGIPSFTKGLDLMSRAPAMGSLPDTYSAADIARSGKRGSYLDQLANLGFYLKQGSPGISGFLSCAYLADNFPTDTFTNEYGENFLQKITNVASEGMAGLSQMFGGRSLSQTMGNITETGKAQGGYTKKAFEGVESVLDAVSGVAQKIGGMNPTLGRIVKNADVLAAGGRIDFPMLWKNSTYTPSYTMTIRLYNPNPNSSRVTAKYIIGPIAALLLLGLPTSVGAGSYSWPFIHRFYSPGIYDLDPGYISNITIVKGGDQQQIAWKQRMGLVDVRIDFGSVFNSILSNASESRNRPTLKGYLAAMADEKSGVHGLTDFARANNESNQSPASIQNTKNNPANATTNKERLHWSANRAGQRADIATTQEQTQMDIPEPDEEIPARINQDIKKIADNLIDLIPGGVRVIF
jgi:hypothetical protein